MTMKRMYKKAGLKGGQHKLDKNKDGKLSGADFKMMKHGGVKNKMYKKGGAKPDYLDMDKDGNKKESMKSAIKSKKYKMGGVMGKQKTRKKQMGGVQSPRPAASFIEPPMEQPFDQNSFVAQRGGVRKLRKEQREERRDKRRADRKADREAIRTLKKSSRETRKAKPFKDGAGPIVEMTRSERRADRIATNKASRIFRKQERKARRAVNRADKKEDKIERKDLKAKNRQARQALINKKLKTLNESESSSVKTKPFIGPQEDPNKGKEKTVVVKKEEKKSIVNDKMSFSQAYRAQRNANKASGKNENFTWRGKKYTTESRSEKAKRTKNDPLKDIYKVLGEDVIVEDEKVVKPINKQIIPKSHPVIPPTKVQAKTAKGTLKEIKKIPKRGGYRRRGGIK